MHASVHVGQKKVSVVVGWGLSVQWEVDKLVCACVFFFCLWLHAAIVCLPGVCVCVYWDLIKTCWASVGGGEVAARRMKKCESWSGRHGGNFHDLGKRMLLLSLTLLSPRGRRLVQSCERQDATKAVSLHPAPLWNFPLTGLLTATITSFVGGKPAHLRGVLAGRLGLHRIHTHDFYFYWQKQGPNMERIMWNRGMNSGWQHITALWTIESAATHLEQTSIRVRIANTALISVTECTTTDAGADAYYWLTATYSFNFLSSADFSFSVATSLIWTLWSLQKAAAAVIHIAIH